MEKRIRALAMAMVTLSGKFYSLFFSTFFFVSIEQYKHNKYNYMELYKMSACISVCPSKTPFPLCIKSFVNSQTLHTHTHART